MPASPLPGRRLTIQFQQAILISLKCCYIYSDLLKIYKVQDHTGLFFRKQIPGFIQTSGSFIPYFFTTRPPHASNHTRHQTWTNINLAPRPVLIMMLPQNCFEIVVWWEIHNEGGKWTKTFLRTLKSTYMNYSRVHWVIPFSPTVTLVHFWIKRSKIYQTSMSRTGIRHTKKKKRVPLEFKPRLSFNVQVIQTIANYFYKSLIWLVTA